MSRLLERVLKHIVAVMQSITSDADSGREDDTSWPKKNIVGRQELEVRVDKDHISFEVSFQGHDNGKADLVDGKGRVIGRTQR